MTDWTQIYPHLVILALDEMSLYFQATLTRVWSPIGQTPVVRITPNATMRIFMAHWSCAWDGRSR